MHANTQTHTRKTSCARSHKSWCSLFAYAPSTRARAFSLRQQKELCMRPLSRSCTRVPQKPFHVSPPHQYTIPVRSCAVRSRLFLIQSRRGGGKDNAKRLGRRNKHIITRQCPCRESVTHAYGHLKINTFICFGFFFLIEFPLDFLVYFLVITSPVQFMTAFLFCSYEATLENKIISAFQW